MAGKLETSFDDQFTKKLFTEAIDLASPKAAEEEAISALIALGYKPQEATRAVGKVNYEGATSQELIRQALRLNA